ncbi:hypothetical protein SR38_02605 [Atlantibacter hermannii]|nr:hypothetical protein SR38_02605 [Atlantibacter hermannii]HAI50811.1 hypothetical protein [Enterobacteriaceae bacterium]
MCRSRLSIFILENRLPGLEYTMPANEFICNKNVYLYFNQTVNNSRKAVMLATLKMWIIADSGLRQGVSGR